MRLGQLARKYDIPVQDIIEHLEEQTGEKFHANAKLYDAIEDMIFTHFELMPASVEVQEEEIVEIAEPEAIPEEPAPEPIQEEIPKPVLITEKRKRKEPETPLDDIASVDGELAPDVFEEKVEEVPEVESEQTEEAPIPAPEPNEDEVIQTDKLLEMLEAGEVPPDLDKIKLIKAPKKELAGLKVLGKVDLPEPKKKEKPEENETKENRRGRNQRPQLSEEEREKRRLEAKRKREAHQAREEKRQKEKEQRELKRRKEAHYRQKLEKAKAATAATPQKRKAEESAIQTEELPVQEQPVMQPKTVLGKFWKWLNT
ncbi:MAG: hypothetical protein RIF46_00065 [Cyclobacteriaceae bacterium]